MQIAKYKIQESKARMQLARVKGQNAKVRMQKSKCKMQTHYSVILHFAFRILHFLVGRAGFEPAKVLTNRFTVCPV